MSELKPEDPNNADTRRMRITMERSFGVVCKTPIAATILESLQCCYGDDNVEVRRLSPTEYIGHDASIDTDCIRFYLLDCIVDRKLRPPRRKGLSQGLPRNMASETPCKIKCYVESDTDSKQDYKYRSAVAISNEASVFYCHLDKFTHGHQNQQLGHKESLVPIGISWLHLIAPQRGTTPVEYLRLVDMLGIFMKETIHNHKQDRNIQIQ
jgi:hypothetical protein